MAGKKTLTRIAGVSLAAALAGSTAIVPLAHAQTGASESSQASSTSTAPVITTGTTTTTSGFADELLARTTKAGTGTGTSGATYTSNGWTYTALALNPENGRVYAISQGETPGHLLRIKANDGLVGDLGKIESIDTAGITSAAFTADGTLVLFDAQEFHTLDLSTDEPKTGQPELKFNTTRLKKEAERSGTPAAWTSTDAYGDADLVSVARTSQGAVFLWTLDTDTGRADAERLDVADGVTLRGIGDLNYAYTQGNGTLVFADDEGQAVKVRGGEVVATDVNRSLTANYAAVAGLPIGSPYQPVTVTAGAPTPTPTTSTEAAATTTETPVSVTTTQTAPAEPTTTVATTTSTITGTPATVWDMNVTVRTEDDKLVEGAEFKLVSGGNVIGATAPDGSGTVQVKLDKKPVEGERFELTLDTPPYGYLNRKVAITVGQNSAELVLPRDPKVTTTNMPQRILKGIDEARPIATSVLAPIAAVAGLGAAGKGRTTTTRTTSTNTTSQTAVRMTGRSTTATGTTTARTASRSTSGSTVARVVADSTSTSAVVYAERDDDLADTGTPMRAIISLGILSILIGAAYLALGRRRDA